LGSNENDDNDDDGDEDDEGIIRASSRLCDFLMMPPARQLTIQYATDFAATD